MNEKELREIIAERLEYAAQLDPTGYAQSVVCGFHWCPEWADMTLLQERLDMLEDWIQEVVEGMRVVTTLRPCRRAPNPTNGSFVEKGSTNDEH